jgi:molybdate transport system regulatory protein
MAVAGAGTRRSKARRSSPGSGPRAGGSKPAAATPPRPQIRIMFRKAIAMGPGKADLLRAIEQSGSISAAARELGMSYRRAWLLVDTMNQCFQTPLVETLTGGQHGGGARVTDLGRDVLRRYLAMEAKAARSVEKDLADFARLMAGSPKP